MSGPSWCKCGGQCKHDVTVKQKQICCRDLPEVLDMIPGMMNCITEHSSFEAVCLDKHVLRIVYPIQERSYRKQGGDETDSNEKYRYTSYRQFVHWCWGYMGRNNVEPIPACVVYRIRKKYPAPEESMYHGFKKLSLGAQGGE